jgi:outer membrane autotransporter protein
MSYRHDSAPTALAGRSARLLAAAAAALAATALTPGLALAQATPGSAQCPVVGNVVTCSGALPAGVAVTSGPYQGLTVSNVTGDMAATNRPVIAYRTDQPNTVIVLDDPDSAVRLTTSGSPGDSLVGAIQTILPENASFSLTTNLDVFVNEASGTGQRMQPFGILVAGEGGTFTIVNSGDVEMRDVDFAPDSASILVDVFGADLVSLTNSGDLTQVNSDVSTGIRVAADNRRVEIANSSDISISDRLGDSGITIEYQPTEYAPPIGGLRQVIPYTGVGGSVSYHAAPVMPLESYAIRNSGLISVESFGIYVNTRVVDQTGTGSFTGDLGAPDGSIVNDGTVRATFALIASHSGDRNIVNNGRLANFDEDEFFGIYVNQGHSAAFLPSTVRIENSSTGVIEYDGNFISWGMQVTDTPASIVNAGRISLGAAELPNRGIDVRGFAGYVGLTTIENSGTIHVDGVSGWGITANFRANPTGEFSDTRLVNSGLIEAPGADSRALEFGHYDISDNPGGAQRGRVSLDLAATSIVRGGSGAEGAAIVFEGGERHDILNRGLITAPSGRAIVGGSAAETLDNSGRIEGSVALAAGDDAVTMRGGAVQIGALDGGANTDSLLFDIATGEASVTGPITNFEIVRKTGAGTLTLRDAGTISPGLSFEAGTLLAEGNLGSTAINAPGGTTFGGSGSVGGVTIADDATISPGGTAIGTLTATSLALSGGSRLRYDLGVPGRVGGADNDLISLSGNLVLDGSLDVIARPGFGDGVYRLINYGGTLTDNGLAMGTAPEAKYSIQTVQPGQVNLVVGIAAFWDGAGAPNDNVVAGGTGTWNATNINWTNSSGSTNLPFSGGTAVFQGAAGVVTVEGAQTVTGMQFVTSGYRLVAGTGGQIVLGGAETAIRVDPGATAELALPLTGTGRLLKRDTGTLILTGANSYSGGTTVHEGVLQVSADNSLGAAAGGLALDGGTLRAAAGFSSARALTVGAAGGTIDVGANTLTLSGTLTGTGTLTRTGAGTLTLSGNGSGFSGPVRVSGGTLDVTGTLGGNVTVDSGARLAGTGTVRGAAVSGTLAPGGSAVGTLTATSNVGFAANSVFEVDITAAGGFDRLAAGGTATLGGGTVSALFSGFSNGAGDTCGSSIKSPILSAQGGVTGTFAGITSNSAFLTPTLTYDSNNVYLTLIRSPATFTEHGATENQQQSGAAAEALKCGATLFDALVVLDAASARAAFDQVSGEIHASTRSALLDDSRFLRDALLAATAAGDRPAIWGQGYGNWGEIDGDGNAAPLDRDGRGIFAGVDVPLGPSFSAGLGVGVSRADYDLAARHSEAELDSRHVAARLSGRFGPLTAMLGAGYSWHNIATRRTVTFTGFTDQAAADYDSQTRQVFAELRYALSFGHVELEPFAGLAHVGIDTDAFEESGGAAAVSGEEDEDRATFSTLGLRGALRLGSARLRGSLGWRHSFDREAGGSTLLLAGGDTPFTIAGPRSTKTQWTRASASRSISAAAPGSGPPTRR